MYVMVRGIRFEERGTVVNPYTIAVVEFDVWREDGSIQRVVKELGIRESEELGNIVENYLEGVIE